MNKASNNSVKISLQATISFTKGKGSPNSNSKQNARSIIPKTNSNFSSKAAQSRRMDLKFVPIDTPKRAGNTGKASPESATHRAVKSTSKNSLNDDDLNESATVIQSPLSRTINLSRDKKTINVLNLSS